MLNSVKDISIKTRVTTTYVRNYVILCNYNSLFLLLSFRGLRFAGLEFRSECYCGQDIYQSKADNETRCDLKCVGDTTEICGGAPYISVFEILGEVNGANNRKEGKKQNI